MRESSKRLEFHRERKKCSVIARRVATKPFGLKLKAERQSDSLASRPEAATGGSKDLFALPGHPSLCSGQCAALDCHALRARNDKGDNALVLGLGGWIANS